MRRSDPYLCSSIYLYLVRYACCGYNCDKNQVLFPHPVPAKLPLNIVYEDEDILVVDVGRYGFVKLQCYTPSYGFEELDTYTDSHSLFEGLWEEWLSLNVFLLAREMQLDDILYEDLFNSLPKEKQSELTGRKGYFAKKRVLFCKMNFAERKRSM